MDAIDKAFKEMERVDFLPEPVKNKASQDMPLPIGFGQTNSQPSTVRMMLEWLEVEPGNKVLDVGSGTGWTAALLSRLAGASGRVYAVDVIPELVETGRQNCRQLNLENVEFHQAKDSYGLARFAPYDRILVSAAASLVPQELINQLKSGGKMVVPVRNTVLEVEKQNDSKIEYFSHPGFAFVPLLGLE